MDVLVINSGSSSIKYQYLDPLTGSVHCNGLLERIGLVNGTVTHKVYRQGKEKIVTRNADFPDHTSGMKAVAELLTDDEYGVIAHPGSVKAVGLRVVHGGEQYTQPVLITPQVKQNIRNLSSLVPLHNPANLMCIEIAETIFPNAAQVAVFDTSFHQTLPPRAFRFAIPESFYEEYKIRVFGFHGISHQYVSSAAAAYLQKPETKIITLHLGNGCSMAAVQDGKSIDTSMGLGALDGLIMGTRCGLLDPTVIFHLIDQLGYSPGEVWHILNKDSGMKGLCGYSDMREVEKALRTGDPGAKLAVEMYAYRIKKFIGAYAAAMNGVDALVFTAGVGENAVMIRQIICTDMEFLGIRLDPERNRLATGGIREISIGDSRVKILVIPTNEELEIARETLKLLPLT